MEKIFLYSPAVLHWYAGWDTGTNRWVIHYDSVPSLLQCGVTQSRCGLKVMQQNGDFDPSTLPMMCASSLGVFECLKNWLSTLGHTDVEVPSEYTTIKPFYFEEHHPMNTVQAMSSLVQFMDCLFVLTPTTYFVLKGAER